MGFKGNKMEHLIDANEQRLSWYLWRSVMKKQTPVVMSFYMKGTEEDINKAEECLLASAGIPDQSPRDFAKEDTEPQHLNFVAYCNDTDDFYAIVFKNAGERSAEEKVYIAQNIADTLKQSNVEIQYKLTAHGSNNDLSVFEESHDHQGLVELLRP
jgi:hypothetical protein